jgi:hypothetical protein
MPDPPQPTPAPAGPPEADAPVSAALALDQLMVEGGPVTTTVTAVQPTPAPERVVAPLLEALEQAHL